MALLPQNLDYTDKDFDSTRARLINLIRSVFPTWTDHNVANFGNILLELKAHVGDVIGFYLDAQAGESRWSTATQRKSLIALTKLIGFSPEGASAATADIEVRVRDAATSGPIVGSFTLPAETLIYTAEVTDPIAYQMLDDTVFLAAHDPDTAVVTSAENSETVRETFSNTDLPNQEDILASTPYLDSSAIVVADDGTYTEVDNFLSSTATDRHFTVTVNDLDRATIRYGNGVNGKIPVGNREVEYKIGGGADGKVEENTLVQIPGSFTDSLSNPVTVTVTNPAEASGAQDRQTVGQIQLAAPESIRVQERAVAREDFEISAREVPGVARALMTTSDQDPSVPENTGFLYVIPTGGGAPSTALKDAVAARFDEDDGETPHTLTFKLYVRDPLYVTINIYVVVFFEEGADLDENSDNYAGASIRADLDSFFAVTNEDGTKNEDIDFGFEYRNRLGTIEGLFPLSDVRNVVRDNTNVRKLSDKTTGFLLNGEHSDVDLLTRGFPQLGTVTIIDGDTLLPVP